MLPLACLMDELGRSEPARAAMALIEGALARRTDAEQGAFWRAVDLYYVSRKAPPEPVDTDAVAASAGSGTSASAGLQ